jgi:hypothetical protein
MPDSMSACSPEMSAPSLSDSPKNLVGVVLDKFGTNIDLRPDGDDHVKARLSVAVSPQLYGWLTGIGASLCYPEDEAAKFKEYLKRIISE